MLPAAIMLLINMHAVTPVHLTARLIAVESGGNPRALSTENARGLMQVTPIALKAVRQESSRLPSACGQLPVHVDLYNPQLNVLVGSCYFKLMLQSMVTVEQAIMAYNAGPGRIKRWSQGTSSLPLETVNYIKQFKDVLHGRQDHPSVSRYNGMQGGGTRWVLIGDRPFLGLSFKRAVVSGLCNLQCWAANRARFPKIERERVSPAPAPQLDIQDAARISSTGRASHRDDTFHKWALRKKPNLECRGGGFSAVS